MKRVTIILISICFALMFASTGTAADVDFSGSYYIEGVYNSNPNLAKTDLATYYRQMRLRVKTDFKVTENLKLTTRFDALEKLWNTDDSALGTEYAVDEPDGKNIDFDRAYMTIISKIGLFKVGRQEGVTWGTTWADDEADTDRFKWVLPLDVANGKLVFVAIAEKTTENDLDPTITSGKDNDKYYFATVYKRDNYDGGLLFGLYDFNRIPDPGQRNLIDQLSASGYTLDAAGVAAYTTVLQGYGAALQADLGNPNGPNTTAYVVQNPEINRLGVPTSLGGSSSDPINVYATRGVFGEGQVILVSPYFQGKFNKLGIQAELDYILGEVSYSDDGYAEPDHDIAAFSYFLEATYDIGPVVVQAGWAHRSGDANEEDDDIKAMGYVSPGLDWEKMFILSSDYHGLQSSMGTDSATLAPIGNHVGEGFLTYNRALLDGFQMPYIGADFSATDKITLGLLAAMSTADDSKTGWDDDQGVEVDAKFTWQLMDNLEYQATVAYLMVGDYWKGGSTTADPDDLLCVYSRLTMTF
jgi:hypothetical protein